MASLLHFQLAEKEFAVAVDRVREILRMPALTELPDGSVTRRGLLDLRGVVIPIYDVRPVLGLGDTGWELRPDQYVLVLSQDSKASAGIIADDVHGVLPVPDAGVEAVNMADVHLPVYQAVARHGDMLLTVLSVDGMVRAARAYA